MSDYAKLKELAEAANAVKSDVNITMAAGTTQEEVTAVQDFLQLAMPKTIMALIADNERLVRRDQMLAEVGCEYCGGSGHVSRIDGEYLGACDQCPSCELSCTKHERDQLKAEIAGLKTGYEAYEQVVQGLKAESEALRKDAERYRWLRLADWWRSPLCVISNPKEQAKLGSDCPSGYRLDAVIDAAIGKGEQS